MKYIKYLLIFAGGLWVILFLIVNLILPVVPSDNWCGAAVCIPFAGMLIWAYYVIYRWKEKNPLEDKERYL